MCQYRRLYSTSASVVFSYVTRVHMSLFFSASFWDARGSAVMMTPSVLLASPTCAMGLGLGGFTTPSLAPTSAPSVTVPVPDEGTGAHAPITTPSAIAPRISLLRILLAPLVESGGLAEVAQALATRT